MVTSCFECIFATPRLLHSCGCSSAGRDGCSTPHEAIELWFDECGYEHQRGIIDFSTPDAHQIDAFLECLRVQNFITQRITSEIAQVLQLLSLHYTTYADAGAGHRGDFGQIILGNTSRHVIRISVGSAVKYMHEQGIRHHLRIFYEC